MISKHMTKEVYEDLPNISVNFKVEDMNTKDLKYVGLCVIEIFPCNTIKALCGGLKNFISYKDKIQIAEWKASNKEIYLEDYYRVDFEKYIFIFQEYIYKDEVILLGNLLKKDFDTRLNLITFYQEHLKQVLLHGRETRQEAV